MQTIITKACKELAIKAVPSKRVSNIFLFTCFTSMLEEQVDKQN